MKKIFTLFLMILVAASICAAPFMTAQEKKHHPGHSAQAEQLDKNLSRWKNFSAKTKSITGRQPAKRVSVAEKQTYATATVSRIAKAANEDVVQLNYDDIYIMPEYQTATGDWALILACYDEKNPAYGHILQLVWYASEDSYEGTFHTEDFNMEWTFLMTTISMGSIFFEEIDMTIAIEQVSDNIAKIVIDATLKNGTDGFYDYPTYQVHAEQEIYVEKEVLNIDIPTATIEKDTAGFNLIAKNNDIDLDLRVKNPYYIADTYKNINAFDLEHSTINYKGTDITPLSLTLIITIEENNSNMVYDVNIDMLGDDMVAYRITTSALMPAPIDTISIHCNNLQVDESYVSMLGGVTFEASNDTYQLLGIWGAEYAEEGTYSGINTDLSITNLVTEEYIPAQWAILHVTMDENDHWNIEGAAIGLDNIRYEFELTWEIPDVNEKIVVSFEHSAQAQYYPDNGNDLMLYNEDSTYFAAINVIDVDFGDEFTDENMDMTYSGFEIYNGETWTPIQIASVKNGLLTQEGEITRIQAELITFDGTSYEVHLWYQAPTPTQVVDLNYPETEFINNLEWGSCYNMLAYSPDSLSMMVLTMPAYDIDEIAGTFVNDGMFGQFGRGQYGIWSNSSFYAVWNEEMEDYDRYFVQKGEVTVTMDQDGKITLTGSIICDNAVQYNVTMLSEFQQVHLDFDAEDGSVDRTFTNADQILIQDSTEIDDIIYFEALSFENKDAISLLFITDESDKDIIIPEGTYEISDSWDYGTVQAATGIDPQGYLSPSFYATFNDMFEIQLPLYFMVGGTVEVTKNDDNTLYFEINAVNSYNIPIHIIYDASNGTAVENIPTDEINDTRKIFKDNQVIILRNGKVYNLMGGEIK